MKPRARRPVRTAPTRAGVVLVGLSGLALVASMAPASARDDDVSGFSADRAGWQQRYEKAFLGEADAGHPQRWTRAMAQQVARVGTPGNAATTDYAVDELRDAGLDVDVDSYSVYVSRPRDINVAQTAPQERSLATLEDVPAGTPNADDLADAYNAYSPAGKVSGEVVYANYGRPEDFAELEKRGVDLDGKIVLARYGANFRGVKSDLAAQHGAAGMLIYSDPADDGFVKGDVYPDGPWRPADAIQRGSILKIYQYPGDPLTPGEPSRPGVPRLQPDDAESLGSIPTTPISYGEAEGLLDALEGEQVPKDWQGGFDFDYRVGPGATEVSLDLDIGYKRVPTRNVVVRIPGSEHPEQTVVVGAHRDTWAYGARDNTSGWVSAMEIARSLAEVYKDGWRPKRTIVVAGWDGEEYGLLGSTEWAERLKQRLSRNAVAYVNMDGTAGNEFGTGAVPSLDDAIYDVTRTVRAPEGGSVFDQWSKASDGDPAVERLGSGSDYTALLDHVGIPSADIGYSGPWGLYHSAYDNVDSIERVVDPGYAHITSAAELSGLLALRMANADVLPFRYSDYAQEVLGLLDDVAADAPAGTDVEEATAQAQQWRRATRDLEARAANILAGGVTPAERRALRTINQALLLQERALTQPEGIPSRPWFKHQVWAPGLTTGYASQPLPALAEAAEAGDGAAFTDAADALEDSLAAATRAAKAGTR